MIHNVTSITGAHEVASALAGFGDDHVQVRVGTLVTNPVRVGTSFAEFRLVRDGRQVGGSVTVHMPAIRYGGTFVEATVSWSSSDSSPPLEAGTATAELIAFLARVAEKLNAWVASGELEVADDGVRAPQRFVLGEVVDVTIHEPGGATPRLAETIRGEVVTVNVSGSEYDVALLDIDHAEPILRRCDVMIGELPSHEGRPVLQNCQREWLTAAGGVKS